MAKAHAAPLRRVLHRALSAGAVTVALAAAPVPPQGSAPAVVAAAVRVMALRSGMASRSGWPGGARRQPGLPAEEHMERAVALRCDSSGSTRPGCDAASLRAIDAARAVEGLRPLALPAGYEDLGVVGQLVAVTNAERAPRGLPAWQGPDAALSQLAGQAVSVGADPNGPAGRTWASNLASGVLTVLQADYEWMYNDGPGGTNIDCTIAGQSGCWEHRDNILSPWAGVIGAAGLAGKDQRLVLAEVMVESVNPG